MSDLWGIKIMRCPTSGASGKYGVGLVGNNDYLHKYNSVLHFKQFYLFVSTGFLINSK